MKTYLEGMERRMREVGFEGELRWTVLPPGNISSSLLRHADENRVVGGASARVSRGRSGRYCERSDCSREIYLDRTQSLSPLDSRGSEVVGIVGLSLGV